ncbi:hypothetical protein L3Q82_008126 [Scortum barcoo]|uniref:Uncharacterized protein n=1 Tax=Scortum barcoo TaxID=214431 RepID=A0ACB8WGN1_9TELE|nr:hypothetical protein L3Q82_008126 [Scortum barcoo]
MLLSAAPRRDRAAAEAVRERLEAAASGLGELDLLRQRQEELVRSALELREEEREAPRSSEEKLLEENILLLRKQLNCLRRRDAGLISQLQELDRQISDLRLDTEASHDQLETDSRPSSGFYELSDGASVSLSNSSNSVFSECFCSMADADGRLPSADELPSCLECDGLIGGLCDDSSYSGTVRRSLSAPHPPTLDSISSVASCDSQSKYHCDLVARNGSDVYRYPSPLHAVAVQSPVFLQMLGHGGHNRDEGLLKSIGAGVEGLKPEASPFSTSCLSASLVPQSSSWAAPSSSQTASCKRLDTYIYSLLQRRALPIRTSRPRTSISTDPSKSILRQASLCVRQVSGPGSGSGLGTLRGSEFKPSWQAGGASTESAATSSSQWSVESKSEEQEAQNSFPDASVDTVQNGFKINNSDLTPYQDSSPLSVSTSTLPKDIRGLGSPKDMSSPKDIKQPCYPPDQELPLKSPPVVKTLSEKVDRSVPETASLGSSSQSQDEAGAEGERNHMVNAKYIPAQQQNVKLCKGGSKNVRTIKVKTNTAMKMSRTSEHKESASEKREGRVLDKHTSSALSSVRSGASRQHHYGTHSSGNYHHHHHYHHHGRDQVVVVAKPKYKRNDYRRLRAITELSSPYSYVAGSDSEYSAECASLFHSTIVDTSEDERSNYTTNCFGDSESSEEEYVEESTTTSDTEESGGGQEMTPAQAKAFVKIKASHNLKKKILRFRSGSLKLMTTVSHRSQAVR